MKWLILCLIVATAQAQVVPTTPTKFKTRGVGTSTSSSSSAVGGGGGATVGLAQPKPSDTIIRTVTYLSLSPVRQWTSTDGRPLLASLIAFEETVTETRKDATQPSPAPPPIQGKPTVIKAGKVRLLASKVPHEVPLEKLSSADRDFVLELQKKIEASSSPVLKTP
ncbi:MAG: hypothetical protein JNM99_08130 [Verrucomicrobiaceae bacterium]|nr:hypothetical protein [Verrucomicrobiaceae bacterium]